MDHSFVGMKGGEIFHEMMLRHNVKHVCEFLSAVPQIHTKQLTQHSRISWRCDSARI